MTKNTRTNQCTYTLHLLDVNAAACDLHPGVQLGRICISQRIPANVVAAKLGVGSPTIMNWFIGKTAPTSKEITLIAAYIKELKQQTGE